MDNIPVWYKRTGQEPKVGEKWIIDGRVRIFHGKNSKGTTLWYCEHNKSPCRCDICKEKYPKTKPKNKPWICITCGTGACFNLPGVRPGYYCKKCKTDEMVNVKFNECLCGKASRLFAFPGEKAICCVACKKEGMIDVKCKRCIKCNINRPIYDLPGTKVGKYCSSCKTDEMVNVKTKRCSCGQIPSFNYPGESNAVACKKCRKDEMIPITKDRCIKCNIPNPIYNLPGVKKENYCSSCKTDEMINVRSKKCPCGKIPNFNLPGMKGGKYCSSCKKEGMIDVKSKRCIKCNICIACFNLPGMKGGKYCLSCKTDEMINVVDTRCKCGTLARSFAEPGEKIPVCCAKCKTDTMVDIRKPICLGLLNGDKCPFQTKRNKNYRGYCVTCFRHNFPLDPLTFQIPTKTKEMAVRDFINANYEGFQHDKPMYTGGCDCSVRRRLDHRKLIGNTLLVVETDENQHKRYDQMDEQIRYDDLFMAYSGKWIYIRFNPDKYHDKNNKKKNPTIATRLEKLKEELDKQIMRIENNENTELLERIYMYYDEA